MRRDSKIIEIQRYIQTLIKYKYDFSKTSEAYTKEAIQDYGLLASQAYAHFSDLVIADFIVVASCELLKANLTKEPPKETLLINLKRGPLNRFIPEISQHYPYPSGLTHQPEHVETFDQLIAAILQAIDVRGKYMLRNEPEQSTAMWEGLWGLTNAFIAYEAVTEQFEDFGN